MEMQLARRKVSRPQGHVTALALTACRVPWSNRSLEHLTLSGSANADHLGTCGLFHRTIAQRRTGAAARFKKCYGHWPPTDEARDWV